MKKEVRTLLNGEPCKLAFCMNLTDKCVPLDPYKITHFWFVCHEYHVPLEYKLLLPPTAGPLNSGRGRRGFNELDPLSPLVEVGISFDFWKDASSAQKVPSILLLIITCLAAALVRLFIRLADSRSAEKRLESGQRRSPQVIDNSLSFPFFRDFK